MKSLKFRPPLAKLITDGKKTTTWRLFDNKDLQVGDVIEMMNSETKKVFGRAVLTEVTEKPIRELNDSDWEGHERFPDEEAMYSAYRSYYPGHEIGPDTLVKILHFVPIKDWDSDFPEIIKEVGFEFPWKEEKVWTLKIPVEDMPIEELSWHFDIPFHWQDGGKYNLTSREIIEHPEVHKKEYERTMNCDLKYPIDVMENKGRWLILDGLHRLMKAQILKIKTVRVRKIPRSEIPKILEVEGVS